MEAVVVKLLVMCFHDTEVEDMATDRCMYAKHSVVITE